tara:strand:+ start:237 stop:551 length:315 start_codon:yes stop_codon:yes gene_type:complete
MSDIDRLTAYIIEFCQKRDWTQNYNAKDLTISLSVHASDLLEHFQTHKKVGDPSVISETKKEEIADDVADVAIYLFQLAHFLGIDLSVAIEEKMAKNMVKYPIE